MILSLSLRRLRCCLKSVFVSIPLVRRLLLLLLLALVLVRRMELLILL